MKVKDAKKGWPTTNGHLFSICINIYLIRYQLKSNLHNYGKCLENMIHCNFPGYLVKNQPQTVLNMFLNSI